MSKNSSTGFLLQTLIDENERLRRGLLDEIPGKITEMEHEIEERDMVIEILKQKNKLLRLELAMMIERFQPERAEKIRRTKGKRKGRIDASERDDPPRGVWIE